MSVDEQRDRENELARLSAVIAKLGSDPEHQREMAALPPLTPEQRHIIGWAFRRQTR